MFKFFSILFLTTQLAFAYDAKVFNSKWAYSNTITNVSGTSRNETKLFKRYIWIDGRPIAVSEAVVTFVHGIQGKTDLAMLAKDMKIAFGPKIVITPGKNRFRINGPFDKINRFIDVTVEKKANRFMVITSFTRMGFYETLRPEVFELHNQVGKHFLKSERVFSSIWKSLGHLFISEAHAQVVGFDKILQGANAPGAPVPSQAGGGLPSSSPNFELTLPPEALGGVTDELKGVNSTISDQGSDLNETFNSQGDQLNETITTQGNQLNNTLNTQGDKLNETLNTQGNQLNNTLNTQGDKLNETISTQGNNLNQNLTSLNSQAEKANANWAESNRLIGKVLDPDHMAKVAFYSAAGAALGALSVNLAVQGVSAGLGFVYELFTQKKQKALEWKDFQKAMEVWDTQLNDLVQMEKIVDNFIHGFEFFKTKNLGTDYVKILTTAVREMGMDKEIFLEKFKDQSQTRECRAVYYNAADELDAKIAEYRKILDLAKSNPVKTVTPEEYFCEQLQELKRRILSAEQSLQEIRLKILVAERQFYDKETKGSEWRKKNSNRLGDLVAEARSEQLERKSFVSNEAKKNQETLRNAWVSECVQGKNPQGIEIREKTKSVFGGFKRKRLCSEAYKASPVSEVAENAQSMDAQSIRKNLVVGNNDFVDMNLSEQQEQWFTKIHMDAYCYKFAHGEESEIPKSCKEFPGTLYSIGMARGYDKADAAFKNSCAEKYNEGIKKVLAAITEV